MCVLIVCLGKKSFVLNKYKIDKAVRILNFDITLDANQCISTNFHNAFIETDKQKF